MFKFISAYSLEVISMATTQLADDDQDQEIWLRPPEAITWTLR